MIIKINEQKLAENLGIIGTIIAVIFCLVMVILGTCPKHVHQILIPIIIFALSSALACGGFRKEYLLKRNQ